MTGSAAATVSVVVASLFLTLAALWANIEPTARTGQERRPLTAAWFSYLPYGGVAAGLVLMVAVTLHTGQILTWGGLVFGLVVMTAGVACRQLISLRDSQGQQAIDPLTGLLNLAGLERHARQALSRGEPLAALYLDLDGFKAINDGYGLHTGDQLLLDFAHLLRALGALSKEPGLLRQRRAVLTPNVVEAGHLLGRGPGDDLASAARELAGRYGAVVSLYGHIADPDGSAWREESGDVGLGTSGSGDARAGIVAGLLGRGAGPAQAACWGAYAHAVSGQRLAPRFGRTGFLARELVDEVAYTIATV